MNALLIAAALPALVVTASHGATRDRGATLRFAHAMHDYPAVLHGRWRVGAIKAPGHRALPADLADQLADARPPRPGEVVRSLAGKLCMGSVSCDEVTWRAATLDKTELGQRLIADFKLPAKTATYVGETGNKYIDYMLIEQPDQNLAAVIYICDDAHPDVGCRTAFEA